MYRIVFFCPGKGTWKHSERVNSSQSFYTLQGLQSGSEYRLKIDFKNKTLWEYDIQTAGASNHKTALIMLFIINCTDVLFTCRPQKKLKRINVCNIFHAVMFIVSYYTLKFKSLVSVYFFCFWNKSLILANAAFI